MAKPEIYIGTSGWSYDDWINSFYPGPQDKNFDWLEFYSQFFNVVEVNSTYYTYLGPQSVKGWLDKTSGKENFEFIIKLHQDFTHKRSYTKENIKAVRTNLDLLAGDSRLGGILIQFPYSFSCHSENILFVKKLLEEFSGYQKFVEVRHNSWLKKTAKTITFCSIDMPVIGETVEFKPITGNGMAYVRLHGRNEEGWKNSIKNFGNKQNYSEQSERYKYFYMPGELALIERSIKEIYDSVKKIYVLANNHPFGYAVANAFELKHLLEDKIKISIPETTVKTFPRLQRIAL